MEQNSKEEKKRHIPAFAVMLIIAVFALLIGIILPPVIKNKENKRIASDCKTASAILFATLTWTASGSNGVITCTNGITDLQDKVTALSGNISRKSKTLGTAVWTVTVYPDANSSIGFTVNGSWSGAFGADDCY